MRRWLFRIAAASSFLSLLAVTGSAGHKKKEEEPKPQVLPLPKELPRALPADTESLSFKVTPLLTAGHLSSQIRDTIAMLLREKRGGTIIKLRAFVAGAGDSRRVEELVGDMFADKKAPLPVLTIVQVGALGNDASAVVMEAVISEPEELNPDGLAFFAGQTGSSLADSVTKVQQAAATIGLSGNDVVSATCFTARFTGYGAEQQALSIAFPNASTNLVQAVRDPTDGSTTCQVVARLRPGLSKPSHSETKIALVTNSRVVFTGLQLSFGAYLADADSALSHLQHDVEAVHADVRNTIRMNAYSVNPAAVSALEKTMPKFNLPESALTVQAVEGLPSLDAALGMEAILVPGDNANVSSTGSGTKIASGR